MFNIKRPVDEFNDYDHGVEKPKGYRPYGQETESFRRREKYMQNGNQFNQKYVNAQEISERYSNKIRQNRMEERYVTEFDLT